MNLNALLDDLETRGFYWTLECGSLTHLEYTAKCAAFSNVDVLFETHEASREKAVAAVIELAKAKYPERWSDGEEGTKT